MFQESGQTPNSGSHAVRVGSDPNPVSGASCDTPPFPARFSPSDERRPSVRRTTGTSLLPIVLISLTQQAATAQQRASNPSQPQQQPSATPGRLRTASYCHDSRFTATDVDAAGETEEFDPSNTALQGAYTALFSDYVKSDLKWETDLHYDTSGNVRPWTYDQNRYMDMTEPLRQTMAKNPVPQGLRRGGLLRHGDAVLGSEINFWHLGYDPTFTQRFAFGYYEAGT